MGYESIARREEQHHALASDATWNACGIGGTNGGAAPLPGQIELRLPGRDDAVFGIVAEERNIRASEHRGTSTL